MHRIFLSLISMSIVLMSSAATGPANTIKVSGVVCGIPSDGARTLIINECDISEKSERCIAELDSSGRFDVTIPYYYGHTFTINYNRNLFINAYAEPGDSVFVRIDASVTPVEFHLSGDHGRLNEEYSHAHHALSAIYYDVTLPSDIVPLSEYMPKFRSEVARTRESVEKYVAEKSLMAETAELLYIDNIFNIANQAIGFRGKSRDERASFFTDSIFDIMNPNNTKVMIFPYHLSALMRSCPRYLETMPKGLHRDLMYASARDTEKPDRNDFANTAYYDRLYADVATVIDYSGIKPDRIVVMENDSVFNIDSVNPVDWLLNRFRSRPIYLDISASWCGPCRAALAAGENVRQFFKDTDIVFAVIWLKSDLEKWTLLAPEYHNAVHIFVPDDDMSNRIMAAFSMRGFPSYYFIGRDGNLSGERIPHFNDSGLVEFLRPLVRKR